MDVKTGPLRIEPQGTAQNDALGSTTSRTQSNNTTTDFVTDRVSIDHSSISGSIGTNDTRAGLNDAISALNVAAEETTKTEQLVNSLSGVIEQASQSDIPEHRRAALEKEAKGLAAAVQESLSKKRNGIEPDNIRKEVEQKLGKALDAIFPDPKTSSPAVFNISVSTKEAIIETQTSIERARRQLESVRKGIENTRASIQKVAATLDSESAGANPDSEQVRNIDGALELTSQASKEIAKKPSEAVGSYSGPKRSALDLLE